MGALTDRAQDLADYIDHHHPRLGSRLMSMRFGGLRSTEPRRQLVAGVLGAGATGGLGAATLLRRASAGRVRAPWSASVLSGAALSWLALWRWDSRRWHRSHVVVLVDLPDDRLDELLGELSGQGLDVRRWDGPRRADGSARGLACRLRDLRRVNAEIDLRTKGAPR